MKTWSYLDWSFLYNEQLFYIIERRVVLSDTSVAWEFVPLDDLQKLVRYKFFLIWSPALPLFCIDWRSTLNQLIVRLSCVCFFFLEDGEVKANCGTRYHVVTQLLFSDPSGFLLCGGRGLSKLCFLMLSVSHSEPNKNRAQRWHFVSQTKGPFLSLNVFKFDSRHYTHDAFPGRVFYQVSGERIWTMDILS